ncbi:n terminal extension of bacteriophage endosialidase [Roseburia sp. CAG:380]|jgi:hypothetical protein|uniref:hypothetical protein n=1 Tax=Roseburia sp. AM59-24XD TaxID=2293138 RepID=UPI0003407FAF|nr:hypothetical protein [Roseburia sp. AM59-24XD]MBS5664845.1 endosialidase [Roseburia sp.]RHP84821.1 endosialidase [Roseburia sp. AM59-24XD]CDC92266.1 n terminal extension of bacteriophage endosialidase [Roseburia sp. CAG:380]HCS15553.1 endosialidase [Lachnospiraceae bacterium]
MAVITELIRKEADGTLSFGNFDFDTKQKKSDFEYEGDMYKIKTFKEITKLEKNGMFVYESVPGTVVTNMKSTENEVVFNVEGWEDSSITLELEPEQEYKVLVDNADIGRMKTNLGGKLNISVELNPGQTSQVKVEKL